MIKIKIGLYVHKETGQFDVMINQINNTLKVRNGDFDLVKEFNYNVKSKKEILNDEFDALRIEMEKYSEDYIIPFFIEEKSTEYLYDDEINKIRTTLYDLMCKRRQILKVTEFTKETLNKK